MRRSRTVHDGGESIVPPRERGSLFGQVVVSVVMLRTDICGHVVENTITVILWNAESGHSRLQSATQIMRAGRICYPAFGRGVLPGILPGYAICKVHHRVLIDSGLIGPSR